MTRGEAINKLRQMSLPKEIMEIMEAIAPELRESEDERIMKAIIQFFRDASNSKTRVLDSNTFAEWATYLEKQKEQKLKTFNEPYDPDEYEVVMEGNATSLKRKERKPIKDVIKDITKNKESAINFLKSAGIMDDNGELAEMYRSEQKPADYDHEMWKNCEANFEGGKKEVIDHPEKYGLQKEQKPVEWSDEDKERIDHLSFLLTLAEIGGHITASKRTELGDFLIKNLRPQSKQEWNEEDEAHRNFILESLEDQIRFCKKDAEGAYYAKQIRTAQNWLKSLHPNKQD